MGINDKLIGTVSNKIRKISYIKRYIANCIDNDQEIKRLMRYMTKLPLAQRGIDYSGDIIVQPDLKRSLMKESEEGKQCLFARSFNPEMQNCQMPFIFVHNYTSDFDEPVGRVVFAINILMPERYDELSTYWEERIYEIAERIANNLDGCTTDGEISDYIGNITLRVKGSGEEWRLTKAQDTMVFTFFIQCNVSNMRVIKDE